jgi:3-dehydroquinate synthase
MTEQTSELEVSGANAYGVRVGRGIRFDAGELLGSDVRRVLIVHQPTLAAAAAELRESLTDRYEVLLAEVPDAEAAKRVEVAAFCWQIMGQADFTRSDAVIGFGGGAATDLAGFVAATIGGKTGINTAEGKNLVGAFYAPAGVLCDLDTLDALPRNDLLAGYAEIVKAGFIWAPEILDNVEGDLDAATDVHGPVFRRNLELAIDMKAKVVSEDFREAGLREILNYGHTLGHAIEHAERYQWRHGAAVSVGMVFAAELARLSGRLHDDVVDRHRSILTSLTLPITYPSGRWQTLLATMQRDKKTRGNTLRFIVLDDIARPTVMQAPDPSLLFAAYQEIGS